MAKRLCIVCRERLAELPDRNAMGRPIKKVCRQCHSDRLQNDLKRVVMRLRLRRGLTPGRT